GQQLMAAQTVTSTPGPGGATVFTMAAGAGDGTVELLRFLPPGLTVRVGDTIVWEDRDPANPHTVTFNPQLLGEPEAPPLGTPREAFLDFPPFFNEPSGGPAFNGQGFVNSAIFGIPAALAGPNVPR